MAAAAVRAMDGRELDGARLAVTKPLPRLNVADYGVLSGYG